MHALSNPGLLALWERGSTLHPLDQGLLALSAALPDQPPDGLADWPLGRRNRALAELHCCCFGSTLQAWTSCPTCNEKMEFEMDVRTLMSEAPNADTAIEVDGQSFRLPTSRDLAQATREPDPHSAANRLLLRCCLGTDGPQNWSDEELERVGDQLALADPMAEVRLSLLCPACNHQWHETLDIARFLWAKIDARARRLLWEIHTFASAYGWTEAEILSLSAMRRARYLEMIRA
jgi:hypothetical protein